MYCKKCAQPLVPDAEKALDGEIQEVWRSTLTDGWICMVDGDEHEPGSLGDWAIRVQGTLGLVKEMVELGDLTADQGLYALFIDAGLIERSDFHVRLSVALANNDPAALLALLEEGSS